MRVATGCWSNGAVAVAGAALTVVAWGDLTARDGISNLGTVWRPSPGLRSALSSSAVRATSSAGSCWARALAGFLALGSAYAMTGITTTGNAPGARVVGALAEWDFIPAFAASACMLLFFPTGSLPSRRWRPVAVARLLGPG